MTIKDIARLSGYAVGTVSRVLNGSPNVSEAARQKIDAVVKEYNFQLNNNAKHLKQQVNSGIAVIVKGTQNMLFASIVEQLQGVILEKGFVSQTYYIDEDDNEVAHAIQICRERRPQGILFLGSAMDDFRQHFSAIAIPCVLVTNSAAELAFSNLSSVTTDDTAGAYAAVEHLISLGHRKIGVLGGKMDLNNAAYTRYKGCLQAFSAHNIPFEEDKHLVTARFDLSGGYDAMNTLLDKSPDLTAVFAMSDVTAMGAMRAVHERGLCVPEDISIIGYDGIEMGHYLTPQLTTIRQQKENIALRSLNLLLRSMEGSPADHIVTPFELIPGESVRAI